MSFIISAANGLFTNASTWRLCDAAGSRFGNVTTATALAAANTNTTAFTATTNTQIDGVALRINLRGSGTPLNTLRVWLRCHTNTTDLAWCNVAVSEIPYSTSALQNGGWMFFKFGAPVTLATGNSYSIVANLSNTQTSVSLQSSNATSLAINQLLRSTTAQAPTVNDDLFIVGEWDGTTDPATPISRLVTMDETANTDYGSNQNGSEQREALSVSKNAILRWGGPNAGDPPAVSTNYYLKLSGALTVFSGGQLDIGTIANPIPANSTAIVDFDTAASKLYGFNWRSGSLVNVQGSPRTAGMPVYTCNLSSNIDVGNTTPGVDTDTGWLAGDEVVFASTSRTSTENDIRALTANANASTLTVNSGVTYAHLGTAPYWCEVINLTRNVRFRAIDPVRPSNVTLYTDNNTDIDWCMFDASSITLLTDSSPLNAQFQYCSFRTPSNGVVMFTVSGSGCDAFGIRDSVFCGYGLTGSSAISIPGLTSKSNWRVSECYAIGCVGTPFSFTDEEGTIDNLYAAGCGATSAAGIYFADTTAWVSQQGNTANLYAHSCGYGVAFANGPRFGGSHTITAWRNVAGGVGWGPAQAYQQYINRKLTVFAWGNGTLNLQITGSYINCVVNGSLAGETAFATVDGVKRTSPGTTYATMVDIKFDNMVFGLAVGANAAHTNNDVNWSSANYEKATLYFRNCLLGSANEIGGFTTSGYGSSYHISRRDQVSGGSHLSYYNNKGTITCNTIVYRTASPSEELSPAVVAPESKLESGIKRVALTQAGTANVSVFLRKDEFYNGSAPRLMQRANPAIGVYSDTVLATADLALADTWYAVSGTCAAVIDDGVVEFYVDCDGSIGNIFIDDWSVA